MGDETGLRFPPSPQWDIPAGVRSTFGGLCLFLPIISKPLCLSGRDFLMMVVMLRTIMAVVVVVTVLEVTVVVVAGVE